MTEVTRRGVLGAVAGAAALSGLPATTAQASVDRLRPVRLTTEHLTNPLGIDAPMPSFGWQLRANGTDRAQSAYRIRVASSPRLLARPDLWDSGRVSSPGQTGVAYGGRALRPKSRYYWSVSVWDESGRSGSDSQPAWFETGLPADAWGASWIGTGIVLPKPLRVLPPRQYSPTPLEPGHTLGQTFVSEGPLDALSVFLDVVGTAGCTMTLRRTDPSGAVVARAVLSGLTPDNYGNAIGRLAFSPELAPGTYYLELSDAQGSVAWQGLAEDLYPDGVAYVDGAERPGEDRWVFGLPPDPPADPVLRKEFALPARVESARLYVVGLGHAVAYVNGERVGDAVLEPGATNFDQRVLYRTHDVTSLLRRGANAIGVELGRGFFSTRAPDSDGANLAAWIAEPQLLARLEILLSDGRRVVVGTGPDWSVADGPTTYDGPYTGESYDARRAAALSGWTRAGYDAASWRRAAVVPAPAGRLVAYAGEPMRRQPSVSPVRVTSPAEGVRLYDFGRVLAGWVRLCGRLPAGAKIRLLSGEKLGPDGRVYLGIAGGNDNPSVNGRLQVDEYVASGAGRETWEPSFTYKSFQYVEVTGVSEPLDLVAVPVRSDVPVTMKLSVEHRELQWIADAFLQTAKNSIHGFPDASPFSKVGWLGTVTNQGPPLLYQFGMASVFARWLDDIAATQSPSGALPLVAPLGGPPAEFLLSPGYVSVYADLVWRYWLTYGDRSVVARHFDGVKRSVDWMLSQLRDGLADDTFGDWYPPNPQSYPRGPEGGKLVGTAYVIKSVRNTAALASVLGRDSVASSLRARERALVARFNSAFLKSSGVYETEVPTAYRQTSNAVPLALGLVPSGSVARVAAGLAADVESKQRHLDTGSMGTGALPYALSDFGRPDLAVAVLGQKTYPGYGYLRSLGATTFWERWEAIARARQDPTLSGPVKWLVERAAGVEPLAAGWARFRVAPAVTASLPSGSVVLSTVRGRVAVSWRRRGSSFTLSVEVPVNAVASVVLPDGRTRELGSGRHRLRARLER
ncbi:alpha-L-rhamnosidase [Tenggerimyces flavus]|uniref:alpha-L-rhamnosidase n=1 Tax=Tenggerimyces flavus TaxID=1708749 RepID=A0ABV7YKF8_9ACTN|nr:alpha-L-rhamnosidase [Tenggerimyces flavus]MBM7789903.1 alpha-L-rhamnosidase [Tenggerimyces flavus]